MPPPTPPRSIDVVPSESVSLPLAAKSPDRPGPTDGREARSASGMRPGRRQHVPIIPDRLETGSRPLTSICSPQAAMRPDFQARRRQLYVSVGDRRATIKGGNSSAPATSSYAVYGRPLSCNVTCQACSGCSGVTSVPGAGRFMHTGSP